MRNIVEASENCQSASSEVEREDAVSEIGALMYALSQCDDYRDGQLDSLIDELADSGSWPEELRIRAYKDLNCRIQAEFKQLLRTFKPC